MEDAPSESNASSSGESREEFHLDFDSFEYSESDSSFEEIASVRRGGRRSFHADGLRSSPATLETQHRPQSGPSERTNAHADSPASSNRTQGLEEHSLNNNPETLSPSNSRRAYEEQLNVSPPLLRNKAIAADDMFRSSDRLSSKPLSLHSELRLWNECSDGPISPQSHRP